MTGRHSVGTLVSSTSGYQTNFFLGLSGSFSKQPDEITVGPDGKLWFAESHNWAIGSMDTTGNLIGEYNVPNASSSPGPLAITAGPVGDAHVWYTEPFENGGGLGDYSNVTAPGGVAPGSAFFTGNANSQPVGIRTLGANIWMTLQGSSQLYIFDTTGTPVATVALTGGTAPNGLAVGSDGNMYVTGLFGNNILAFLPDAAVHANLESAGSDRRFAAGRTRLVRTARSGSPNKSAARSTSADRRFDQRNCASALWRSVGNRQRLGRWHLVHG